MERPSDGDQLFRDGAHRAMRRARDDRPVQAYHQHREHRRTHRAAVPVDVQRVQGGGDGLVRSPHTGPHTTASAW
eukprot:31049-Pelagococcus_subviridis.AAC.7